MKNEFVIPKDAFLTCFTPFYTSTPENNYRNVIAFSALLKKDIKVDFDNLKEVLIFMGISRIKIIYFYNDLSVNKEFIDNINKFALDNPSFNHTTSSFHPYSFSTANLWGYFKHVSSGQINVLKGGLFDTQHCLFIFNGYN